MLHSGYHINMMLSHAINIMFEPKLQQLSKLVKDEISVIENGGKLSSFKREVKPREKELKTQLKTVVKNIAGNGQVQGNWAEVRTLFIVLIKDLLDSYNLQYKDSKTFDEEREVILQYFVFFERPPFTLQRIAELLTAPEKYYKSTKKILYAFEKLVNVSDPEQR